MVDCTRYAGDTLREAWLNGDFMSAVVCPYDNQLGALTFGVFIYGGVVMALRIRTGSFLLPMILTFVGGTVAVSRLPAGAMQIMGMGVMLVVTAAAFFLYRSAQRQI